jgi:hypothetical protein
MKVTPCYFYYEALFDGYITQSIMYDSKIYFHYMPNVNLAFPENIAAVWKIKFKSI